MRPCGPSGLEAFNRNGPVRRRADPGGLFQLQPDAPSLERKALQNSLECVAGGVNVEAA